MESGEYQVNDQAQIKYTFHNASGETVEMTFTIMQIKGTTGGFMNKVNELLELMEFGKPTEVYRMLVL